MDSCKVLLDKANGPNTAWIPFNMLIISPTLNMLMIFPTTPPKRERERENVNLNFPNFKQLCKFFVYFGIPYKCVSFAQYTFDFNEHSYMYMSGLHRQQS